MRPQEIAQAISQAMSRQAQSTRAMEKAKITDIDADGNAVVEYRGVEITLPRGPGAGVTVGQWVLVERTNSGLQIGGPSAYGAG